MKKAISFLLCTSLLITGVLFMSACNKNNDETTTEPTTEEVTAAPIAANINPLTGEAGYDETKANSKPICVVVENSPDARPQWGMSTPDILMEYEVEGGISRMLWLYADASRLPDKIGPVRSARHDIVELALGLDGIFIHAGASVYAQEAIEKYAGKLQELDGNNATTYFVRDTSRNVGSEHRYVLMGKSLGEAISTLGIETLHKDGYVSPFVFSEAGAPVTLSKPADTIDFSYSASYNYTFKYDEATSKYNCELNGAARKDDADIACAYSNVIVLYVDMTDMQTSSGHQDLELQRGGKGFYANGGTYEEINWTKGDAEDNIKLYTATGELLVMNPGNSYIGLVRSTRTQNTKIA